MKTKAFNLEEALNGAKVITRDFAEVTQLAKFQIGGEIIVAGVVGSMLLKWDVNGRTGDKIQLNDFDLFITVETKRFWVNVYRVPSGEICLGPKLHDSKEEAEAWKWKDNYLKTIEITDEP